MKKRTTHINEPLGDLEVIADFLPPPTELAFREEGVKITLALGKKSVDFFKVEASKHQTQYQRMIRRLLDVCSTPMSTPRTQAPWLVSQNGQPASGLRHSCNPGKESAEMPPTA